MDKKENIKLVIQIPAGVDVFIDTVLKPFDPLDQSLP